MLTRSVLWERFGIFTRTRQKADTIERSRELDPTFVKGLSGLRAGDEILVITWLHLASRDVLEVHPRGDLANPLTGVFATRSPHRPNPLGLHPVTVLEITAGRLRIGPIEAIDGTPVIDIKILMPGDAIEQ